MAWSYISRNPLKWVFFSLFIAHPAFAFFCSPSFQNQGKTLRLLHSSVLLQRNLLSAENIVLHEEKDEAEKNFNQQVRIFLDQAVTLKDTVTKMLYVVYLMETPLLSDNQEPIYLNLENNRDSFSELLFLKFKDPGSIEKIYKSELIYFFQNIKEWGLQAKKVKRASRALGFWQWVRTRKKIDRLIERSYEMEKMLNRSSVWL